MRLSRHSAGSGTWSELFQRTRRGQHCPSTATTERERGALLVEFALLAPFIIMLLLGTVTMGMGYNRSISINNGARESARYGATLPVADDISGWLNSVADVARESAAGDIDAGVPNQTICVAFVYPEGSETHDRTIALVETSGSRLLIDGGTCFTDGRPDSERRVQVAMGRDSEMQAGVYSTTMYLTAHSVARYERA